MPCYVIKRSKGRARRGQDGRVFHPDTSLAPSSTAIDPAAPHPPLGSNTSEGRHHSPLTGIAITNPARRAFLSVIGAFRVWHPTHPAVSGMAPARR